MQRKRKPKPICTDNMLKATLRATKLTEAEVQQIIAPLEQAIDALRTCSATMDDYVMVCTASQAAREIEKSRIVRGLREQIDAADRALWCIYQRATSGDPFGAWHQRALYADELDALRTLAEVHKFQVEQLSSAELHKIIKRLEARTQSSGGEVIRIPA